MRINFQFDTEKVKKEKLYDESANVEYEGTLVTDCFVKEIEEIIDKKEFVSVNRTFEVGEKYTMKQIAGNDEPNYIRECGKAWDKLWDYFDVAEYKDICFPKTKKWSLTSQEKDFLKCYFAEVCREAKDDGTSKDYDRTAKREVKSFLDKRKTKLGYDEKEKIEWAARNLYQMIRVRSGITEEIRGKFYKSTIDKLYSREKNFDDIEDAISAARDLAFNDNGYDSLSIKEKEVWTSGLADELLLLIEKWMDIFEDMNSLKKKNMDKNKEITKPEHLLEDVIKKKTE